MPSPQTSLPSLKSLYVSLNHTYTDIDMNTHIHGVLLRCLPPGAPKLSPVMSSPHLHLWKSFDPRVFQIQLLCVTASSGAAAGSPRVRLKSPCWSSPGARVTDACHLASAHVREPQGVSSYHIPLRPCPQRPQGSDEEMEGEGGMEPWQPTRLPVSHGGGQQSRGHL